jgi:hypothetical protein
LAVDAAVRPCGPLASGMYGAARGAERHIQPPHLARGPVHDLGVWPPPWERYGRGSSAGWRTPDEAVQGQSGGGGDGRPDRGDRGDQRGDLAGAADAYRAKGLVGLRSQVRAVEPLTGALTLVDVVIDTTPQP